MDGICRDCGGTGEVATETGHRSAIAPYAPTMTWRYCDCAAGQANIGEHFGPIIPDAEIADRLIEAQERKLRDEGFQPCRGDYWCTNWVEKPEKYCDTCKKHICD